MRPKTRSFFDAGAPGRTISLFSGSTLIGCGFDPPADPTVRVRVTGQTRDDDESISSQQQNHGRGGHLHAARARAPHGPDRARRGAAWTPARPDVSQNRAPDVPARVWSRAARFYDLQLPLETRALEAAVELAGAGPDDRLIDVATGTGGLLRRLARRPARPKHAVGVDASEAMLGRAPVLPPGWELRRADARALPFPGSSFDVATVCYLLHLLGSGSRREVLREAVRILAPGGRIVVVTPAAPRGPIARALAAPVLELARRSSGALAGLRPLHPTAELVEAGFEVTSTRRAASVPPSTCALGVLEPRDG